MRVVYLKQLSVPILLIFVYAHIPQFPVENENPHGESIPRKLPKVHGTSLHANLETLEI